MKKQTKNIIRKDNQDESSISSEQLRLVLYHCYNNVQRYGVKIVLKNLDMLTRLEGEDLITCTSNLHVKDPKHFKNTIYDCKETTQQNALFLIESFKLIKNDESNTLIEMKQAYEKEDYDDVIDLAYLHDRYTRSVVHADEKIQKIRSPWKRFFSLFENKPQNNQSLKHCIEALKLLSCDFTYDNRTAAKTLLQKAIKKLESH